MHTDQNGNLRKTKKSEFEIWTNRIKATFFMNSGQLLLIKMARRGGRFSRQRRKTRKEGITKTPKLHTTPQRKANNFPQKQAVPKAKSQPFSTQVKPQAKQHEEVKPTSSTKAKLQIENASNINIHMGGANNRITVTQERQTPEEHDEYIYRPGMWIKKAELEGWADSYGASWR